MINLDDKQRKETCWVSLFINKDKAVYFDSFGIEYIPEGELNKIKDKYKTIMQDKRIILLSEDYFVSLSKTIWFQEKRC